MARPQVSMEQARFGRALGSELRRLRGVRSARALSAQSEVALDTIRKLESGVIASPGFALVGQLAQGLQVSLDSLYAAATAPDVGATP